MLTWWKMNEVKYSILLRIARDILVIHVSTVASKLNFGMGGRVMSKHHSRLHPDTIEALICAQDLF